MEFPSGFLVLDKPAGMTSRAVVDRVQSWFPPRTRLGHTGTLDPLATGVLVMAVGQGTRLTEYVQRMEKTYRAGICFGARSDTDDADGAITPVTGAVPPDRATVEAHLHGFLGEIAQVPPAYSAAKVAGRRAYALARKGKQVDLQPRRVRIYDIQVLAYDYPRLEIVVRCGKGTYIRALARDLGARLGCGGLITALRRTRVGPFAVDRALSLEADAEAARKNLLPLTLAVDDLPQLTLPDADVSRLRHGQSIAVDQESEGEVAVFSTIGEFVGIGWLKGARLQPVKILSHEGP